MNCIQISNFSVFVVDEIVGMKAAQFSTLECLIYAH